MPELLLSLSPETWAKIGLCMLLIDMILVSGVFISLAVGALVVASLTTYFTIDPIQQTAIFSLMSITFGMALWLRKPAEPEQKADNLSASTLFGRTLGVTKDESGKMTIIVGETLWDCKPHAESLPIEDGHLVRVVGVDGATLIISRAAIPADLNQQ